MARRPLRLASRLLAARRAAPAAYRAETPASSVLLFPTSLDALARGCVVSISFTIRRTKPLHLPSPALPPTNRPTLPQAGLGAGTPNSLLGRRSSRELPCPSRTSTGSEAPCSRVDAAARDLEPRGGGCLQARKDDAVAVPPGRTARARRRPSRGPLWTNRIHPALLPRPPGTPPHGCAASRPPQEIVIQGDFMNMPLPDCSFDAAYALEATCHAPDAVGVYRVLKPGQLFAMDEWCMTDKYDPGNARHQSIKAEIELGNGLPDIRTTRQCIQALKDAGFEVVLAKDLAEDSPLPWYLPLNPSQLSLTDFQFTRVGRFLGQTLVKTLEFLHLAPEGSLRIFNFLSTSVDALLKVGKSQIKQLLSQSALSASSKFEASMFKFMSIVVAISKTLLLNIW